MSAPDSEDDVPSALPPDAEALRALFLARATPAQPGPACPSPAEIFESVRGAWRPLKPRPGSDGIDESLALADHCLTCASCSLALRLAREIQTQLGDELSPAHPRPVARPSMRRQLFAGALAAAGFAAIFLVVQRPDLFVAQRADAPVYRADSIELASKVEAHALPREQFVLRWSALAAGTRYAVNVATPDLNVLFARGGLVQPEVQVPASTLAKLPAGSQVVWRVTALLADGRRIESTAFLTAVQ